MQIWIVIVALLIVLVWVTQLREGFISEGQSKLGEGLPDPSALANQIRGLMKRVNPSGNGTVDVMGNDMSPILNKMNGILGKYDNPESMGHVLSIKDKDPGELARMYLNINN